MWAGFDIFELRRPTSQGKMLMWDGMCIKSKSKYNKIMSTKDLNLNSEIVINDDDYSDDNFGNFCKRCLSCFTKDQYYSLPSFSISMNEDSNTDLVLFPGFVYTYTNSDEGEYLFSNIYILDEKISESNCFEEIDKCLGKHLSYGYSYETGELTEFLISEMPNIETIYIENINIHLVKIMKHIKYITEFPNMGLKFSD